jgi:hypothetical protein
MASRQQNKKCKFTPFSFQIFSPENSQIFEFCHIQYGFIMCIHFKILFCFLTNVHATDTWFFSTSLGADIHMEEQKTNVKMFTYLVTQMAAESLIRG